MKIHVTKDNFGALRPADQSAKEALSKIGAGEYMTAEIKRPRNPKFHRLFFALLDVVMENMSHEQRDQWPTKERLLWEIKLQTGYFQMAESVGGKMYPIPSSISFASMDDVEFGEFFTKALDVCRRYFLPGVSDAELREALDAELAQYISGRVA